MASHRVGKLIFLALLLFTLGGAGFAVWRRCRAMDLRPRDWQTAWSDDHRVLQGSFVLRVRLPSNPETKVVYALSGEAANGPSPAGEMLFYAPYNGDASRLRQSGLPKWLEPFWRQQGFCVFSLVIEVVPDALTNGEPYYIEANSGWPEVIQAARKAIADRYFGGRLSPWCIVGESSGGSLAERLVAARPDDCWCAAWCGGARYVPLPKQTRTALLALNTWGCPGLDATRKLVQDAAAEGVPILSAQVRPMDSPDTCIIMASPNPTYELLRSFVHDVKALRRAPGAQAPPPAAWPVVDEITKQPLPGPAFARQWALLPHALSAGLLLDARDAGPWSFPGPEAPRSLQVVCYPAEPGGDLYLEDTLAFLADHGCRAWALLPERQEKREDAALAAQRLGPVLEQAAAQGLPVSILGMGRATEFALDLYRRCRGERPVKLFLYQPDAGKTFAVEMPSALPPEAVVYLRADASKWPGAHRLSRTGNEERAWFGFLRATLPQ